MDYDVFRKQYEKMHSFSIPQLGDYLTYPVWFPRALLLMFITSAALSGVHTVPTVYNGIESVSWPDAVRFFAAFLALISIELALLLSAYAQLFGLTWLARGSTSVAFLIAVISNLHSVQKAITTSEVITVIQVAGVGMDIPLLVTAMFGVGMPMLALLAGKMYVGQYQRLRVAQQKLREALKAWEKEIEQAWKAYQRKAKKASKPVQSVQLDGSRGYVKDASERARQHLIEHEEDRELRPSVLAKKLGIGRSTAYKVMGEFQANGHGTYTDEEA